MPTNPSPEQLAAVDADVARLLAEMDAVPEEQRIYLTGDRFEGPIAETIINPAAHDMSSKKEPRDRPAWTNGVPC